MNVSFEDQLREQLHASSPYRQHGPAGLDPHEVMAAGRRVQRRRQWGTVLVTTVAVGAIAVGSVVATSARRSAAPQPASPGPTVSVQPGVVDLVAQFNARPDRAIHVVIAPVTAGKVTATFTDLPADASGSPATGGWFSSSPLMTATDVSVDAADPQITALAVKGTNYVVGLVPSPSVNDVEIKLDYDYQGYSQSIEPVPGTQLSAFVLVTSKPVPSDHAVTQVSWFRSDGAPVDAQGRVGTVVPFQDGTLYLTADDTAFGRTSDGGRYGTEIPATDRIPELTVGGRPGSTDEHTWHITALVPSRASRGVATTSDGTTHPFVATPVDARYAALFLTVDVGTQNAPHVTTVVWSNDAAPAATHTITSP